jgi:predicted RNA binding protein YcfA (HicA-like mRNA interferase family)
MAEKDIEIIEKELPEVFARVAVDEEAATSYMFFDIPDPTEGPSSRDSETLSPAPGDQDSISFEELFEQHLSSGGRGEPITKPSDGPSLFSVDELASTTQTSGRFPGITVLETDARRPPSETYAFYLPFHLFDQTWWGVYLRVEGVWAVAENILNFDHQRVLEPIDCWTAARLYLFYHEIYHHNVESLATRLEIAHRERMYITGFQEYYESTVGTPDCIEESLAEANAILKTAGRFPAGEMREAVKQALSKFVEQGPPGYREGIHLLAQSRFTRAQNRLAELSLQTSLPTLTAKDPNLWNGAKYMLRGFNDKGKGRAKYILPHGSWISDRLPYRPRLTTSKLKKKLSQHGCQFHRQGGRHEIWKAPNGQTIPIPRHPGDLKLGLIKGILKDAGINEDARRFIAA